jgi:predicted dehydrogenase
MRRNKIRIGIIGLGLMGKEFASAIARWCHLVDDGDIPVLAGICDRNKSTWKWYSNNFPDLHLKTDDYRELLASNKIDAIYCAVPHNLHEQFYIDIINAKKHLLGEKPFGIDKKANENILKAVRALILKTNKSSQW